MSALTAEGLNTYYGKSHILHDVGLTVAEGRITTLLGRNGAGKTTTLRSLVGLTPPRSGRVTLFGQDITGLPPYRIAAAGIGYVPEGRRVFANLTVDENLRVPIERPGSFTIERVYQLFPRLGERRQNLGRQLSGGEQEMLSIGRALLLNPRLLILDEPSAGAGAVDRQGGVPYRRADADRGDLGSAGGAECADEPGNLRPCLCAGERPDGLFRPGGGTAGG